MIDQPPLTLCGERFQEPIHACAFFASADEQYDVIVPYIKEGLESKERVLNILEKDAHHKHCDCLSHKGIDVEQYSSNGQLQVLATEDTYTQGGSFAAEKCTNWLSRRL